MKNFFYPERKPTLMSSKPKTVYMKKVLLAILISITAIAAVFAQKNNNALYPDALLAESLCPLNSQFVEFANEDLWYNRYFSITDYTNGRLPYILSEMASKAGFTAYGVGSMTDFYPYDYESYNRLDKRQLFKAFGGDTLIAVSNEEEVKLVKMVDTLEIMAVNFIEEWQLDTAAALFHKNVKAVAPVLCYSHPAFDRKIFRRTCIIDQRGLLDKDKSPQLVASVKYEVMLVQQDVDTGAPLSAEDLFTREAPLSPFFSSYSRNMLIRFLESSAITERLKCYNFSTDSLITDYDAILEGFGFQTMIMQIELGNGELRDTSVVERTKYVNSVIFYEEWYIDRKSGMFSKRVKAIAPVLWDPEEGRPSVKLYVQFSEE